MKYRSVPNIGDLLFLPAGAALYLLSANNQMRNGWSVGPQHFLVLDCYTIEHLGAQELVVFYLEREKVVKIQQEEFVKLKVMNEI